MTRILVEERFWSKVDVKWLADGRPDDSACRVWVGSKYGNGYGKISVGGRSGVTALAHRLAYELEVGPVPAGLDLDHLCRVRSCVNPGRLEPVTRRENLLRGHTLPAAHAVLDSCKHGHRLDEENAYLWRGARYCRACRARNLLRYRSAAS